MELLPLAAARHELSIDIVRTSFGQIEQSLMSNGPSSITNGELDYVVLAGTWHDLGLLHGSSTAAAVNEAIKRWTELWNAAMGLGARVVQVGFVPPLADPYGMSADVVEPAVSAAVCRVNLMLSRHASQKVIFVDAAKAASMVGLNNWDAPRYWYSARLPCAPDALPHLAALMVGAIAADCGLTKRCVVMDLDNTLWGGVLGDDGMDGIVLGEGPRGEAYVQFQYYLRGLRQRGLLLAISSKNEAKLVEEVLSTHSRMILRPADFACIVADWRPKSEQLEDIALQLRLSLSHMIFVDDNPAERAQVSQALPEVEVVEMPTQPSRYPTALASTPGLFAGPLLSEDVGRADSYVGLRRAAALAKQSATLDEFLCSLTMSAVILRVDEQSLPRVSQLVAKTNQFNLTTRRRTQAELAQLLNDANCYAITLHLRDRFADHGIVGFALAKSNEDDAEIDTLLLSCRVVGRTAEQMLIASLAKWAIDCGCKYLVGVYRLTDRNQLVANLYLQLGFAQRSVLADGTSTYEYDLANGIPPTSAFIQEDST